jgi:hypothetical protein
MAVPSKAQIAKLVDSCCLNIKDFGAKGDNSTDNVESIQAAIDALTPGGGCICIPPGVYLISRPLLVNAPIEMRGAGRASILRAVRDNFHVIRLKSAATGARLTGFQIQGASTSDKSAQVAILTEESEGVPTNVTIDHMLISGPDSHTGCNDGIQLDRGANEWNICDNTFERLIGTSSGHGYGVLVAAANRNIISRNRFIGSVGQGRHAVYQSSGASYNLVVNNIVGDFNFEAFPIFSTKDQAACEFNQVSGNTITNSNQGIVNIGQFTHDTAAIGVYGRASHNCITGNTIVGYLGVGIIVSDAGSGGVCDGNQVTGNAVFEVGLAGIMISGARNTDVRSNVVFNASQDSVTFPPGTFPGIIVTSAGTFGTQVCDGTNVAGNTSSGPSQRCAFGINTTIPVPTNLVIFGNRFQAGKTPGVAVELNNISCVFEDNVLT